MAACAKGVALYETILGEGRAAVQARRLQGCRALEGKGGSEAAPSMGEGSAQRKRGRAAPAAAADKWATDSEEENEEEQMQGGEEGDRHGNSGDGDMRPRKRRGRGSGVGTPVGNGRGSSDVLVAPSEGCREVSCYEQIRALGEGQYGTVWQGRERASGKIVALKQIKLTTELCGTEGFPRTALREINVLLNLRHENIVRVHEVVVGKSHSMAGAQQIYMVMDYIPVELGHMLAAMGNDEPLSLSDCKCLMRQLCAAISFLHEQHVLHRDVKPSNILYHGDGPQLGRLVLCDFGLARRFSKGVTPGTDGSDTAYTPEVVTLYYRSPEILLGQNHYTTEVDAWSVGCVFAEMLLGRVLLPGRGELDQLDKIFRTLGGPQNASQSALAACPQGGSISWESVSRHKSRLRELMPERMKGLLSGGGRVYLPQAGMALLEGLLDYDAEKRRVAMSGALAHDFFTDELPMATALGSMPRVEL